MSTVILRACSNGGGRSGAVQRERGGPHGDGPVYGVASAEQVLRGAGELLDRARHEVRDRNLRVVGWTLSLDLRVEELQS